MRLALIVLVAVCWSSIANAAEIYVCNAQVEASFGTVHYEVRLAVDTTKDDGALVALGRDRGDLESVGPYRAIYPTTGSISWDYTGQVDQYQLAGFTTLLPTATTPLLAIVYRDGPDNGIPYLITYWKRAGQFSLVDVRLSLYGPTGFFGSGARSDERWITATGDCH